MLIRTYTFKDLFLFFHVLTVLSSKVEHVLAVRLNTLVLLLGAHDNLIELTQTGTSGDKVTADNVLLHTLQAIYLATDGSLVEHLGGFLE